jgi:hypothetical protein
VDESHSQPVEQRGRDKSGHQKELWGLQGHSHPVKHRGTSQDTEKTERARVLTVCRPQRKGQVRTPKETEQARDTHVLSTTEEGTSQDTERNEGSEGHSPTVKQRGRDKSRHRKKPSERGPLTSCQAQREGQVRILKEGGGGEEGLSVCEWSNVAIGSVVVPFINTSSCTLRSDRPS